MATATTNSFLAPPRSLLPLHSSGLRRVSPRTDIPTIPSSLYGSAVPARCRCLRSSIRMAPRASVGSSGALGSAKANEETVPMPIILIDQDSDPDATIVVLSFGDRLGAVIDTMKALKDLGLDVTKGTVTTESSVIKTKFFITRLGRKLENPDLLERVRLTIINNLLKYHPESSEQLAMGEAFGIKAPAKVLINCLRYYLRRPETDEDSY